MKLGSNLGLDTPNDRPVTIKSIDIGPMCEVRVGCLIQAGSSFSGVNLPHMKGRPICQPSMNFAQMSLLCSRGLRISRPGDSAGLASPTVPRASGGPAATRAEIPDSAGSVSGGRRAAATGAVADAGGVLQVKVDGSGPDGLWQAEVIPDSAAGSIASAEGLSR